MNINNTNEELHEEYKKGNKKVESIILDKNKGYIASFANKYMSRIEYEDALQLAKIGMLRSLETWSPSKGKLTTWSSIFMRDELHRFLHNDSKLIKVPVEVISKITTKVISGLELTEKEKKLYNMSKSSSLNVISKEDSKVEIIDLIKDEIDIEASFLYSEIKDFISDKLKVLKDREQLIVKHYYGLENFEEKSLLDLSKSIGLTKQRVSQIHIQAIEKLKKVINKELV